MYFARAVPYAMALLVVTLAASQLFAVDAVLIIRTRARTVAASKASSAHVLQADVGLRDTWVAMSMAKNQHVGGGPLPNIAANDNTDGEMHWLRQHWADVLASGPPGNGVNGLAPAVATLVVGAAGIANAPVADAVVGPYHTNPQADPLVTHADMAAYLLLTTAPVDERTFVTTHRVALAGLAQAPGLVALWPAGGAKYANCHPEIISALITAGNGAGGHTLNKANAGFAATFGGVASCDINKPWATATGAARAAVALNGHLALVPTLAQHYTRFIALLGGPTGNTDIWELRGWLYATDRRYGHRLLGASGTAADAACPRTPNANFEMAILRTRMNNGGAPVEMGFQYDTIGHVRPQSMGGDRDPFNFVPQSNAGQKMLQPAETLALNIAKTYGAGFARYTVLYEYGGVARVDRRPTAARTVVDMLQPGPPAPEFGNVLLPQGVDLFNQRFDTY